jgi:hypothetical protein
MRRMPQAAASHEHRSAPSARRRRRAPRPMVLGRDGEPSFRIDVTVFGLLGHDLIMAPGWPTLETVPGLCPPLVG